MTNIDISPEAVERLACILEGRGGFVKDNTITVTLRALSAALTQSRAETAAAYEAAAHALDAVAKQWSCGHEPKHCDCARDIEQWTFAADEVRALSAPEQSSALAAIEAAAEVRGMRKAADALNGPLWRLILRDEDCIDGPCNETRCECRDKLARILAAAKKGGA